MFYLVNIYYANKISFPLRNLHLFGDTINPVRTFTFDKPIKLISILGGIVVAFLVGSFGASRWEEILLYLNRIDVGTQDPVFGKDVSFYMFTLPLVNTVKGFAGLTVFFTAVVTMTGYFLRGGIAVSEKNIAFAPQVKSISEH